MKLINKEKEQPEQKSHFLLGAMRKNHGFVLIRRSRNIAFAPLEKL